MGKEKDQEQLRRHSAYYRVAPNLLSQVQPDTRASVIVELNIDYPGGLPAARKDAVDLLKSIGVSAARLLTPKDLYSRHHLFLDLSGAELLALSAPPKQEGLEKVKPHPIYKIWSDEALRPLASFASVSVRTIKAEACLTTFGSDGKDIVVAVADSGIDRTHRHFRKHRNLDLPRAIRHRDFTGDHPTSGKAALVDPLGHGTHVAGIIAGEIDAKPGEVVRLREWHNAPTTAGVNDEEMAETQTVPEHNDAAVTLRGVAPKAKLLSLRVLDESGNGKVSRLIAALDYLYSLNDSGRKLNVHCLNLSLGYGFDARWYAAGQSPLCVVVNRLVRSGMVVVVAAGNDGSMELAMASNMPAKRVGRDQSINDPGNAAEAITVGSTHAEAPHLYGVSYFSSRGPTADGREKPDLLAPGERILSCAADKAAKQVLADAGQNFDPKKVYYREESGTSMASAHVAGAAAAFLSIQGEFINEPQRLKKVLMASCTDLGRKRDFQGAGLIDLMRAVQSV